MSRTAKIGYLLLYALLNFSTYFLIKLFVTNDYNFLTPLDSAIPFVPDFIWIYHSLIPVMIGTLIMRHMTRKEFYLNFWSLFIVTIIINICYMLFPSFYPYPEFIPQTWAEHLTFLTHKIDGASNTLPSGHVAFSWLLYLGITHSSESTKGKWRYLVWSFLIAASTLLLKQHYIVDVVAGMLLATACYYGIRYGMEKWYGLQNCNGFGRTEETLPAMSRLE